jgi:hypothetical protein
MKLSPLLEAQLIDRAYDRKSPSFLYTLKYYTPPPPPLTFFLSRAGLSPLKASENC